MRELKGDWRDLFNGFMLSLDLRKMFLGFVGLLLTFATVGVFSFYCANWIHTGAVQPPESILAPETVSAAKRCAVSVVHDAMNLRLPRPGLAMHGGSGGLPMERDGAPRDLAHTFGRSLHVIFNCCDPLLKDAPKFKRMIGGLGVVFMFLLVWSYIGGAIARIAAVEVARDERIETQKALQFAHQKYWSFFWAPLICAIGFGILALCNLVGGGVGYLIDVVTFHTLGDIVVAILLPLAIFAGFVMTLILIGTAFGMPLFAPAIATEGTDAFDAISRGFSYVYSRPWHFAFYQLVSYLYGLVCVGFVWLFGSVMLRLSLATASKCFPHFHDVLLFLSGSPLVSAQSIGVHQMIAAWIVGAWLLVTGGILAGYAVSYFFGSQTIIYYLLRKKVDGIEMNEVYEEQEPEEAAGEVPAGGTPKTDAPPSGKPEENKG